MRFTEHDVALTLRIESRLKRQLEAIAAEQDSTLSQLVRRALAEHVERHEQRQHAA